MNIKNILRQGFAPVMALCAVFASCTSNDEMNSEKSHDYSDLSCVARDKSFVDDADITRSSLSFAGSAGMKFAWTAGDRMTVFAKDDYKATQLYMLDSGEGKTVAQFHADNFRLKEGQRYYALSKTESDVNSHVKTPDQNNITLDYSGQTQIGNAGTSHLGDYDFMAASAYCEDENEAHFSFTHLGSTLRLKITIPAASFSEDPYLNDHYGDIEYDEIEIYDSENSFRQQSRNYSFNAGTVDSKGNYTVKWPVQTIDKMDRFTLKLKGETSGHGVKVSDAIQDGSGNTGFLVGYIEIPPVDFTNKTIGVMLKGHYFQESVKKDVSLIGTRAGFNILNDKIYQINLTMKKPDEFNVTLKINHKWQWGNDVDITRATTTGDPGYDDGIELPKYLYYIYCTGNEGDVKVRAVTEKLDGVIAQGATAKTVNVISYTGNTEGTRPIDHWTTDDANAISTFKHTLTFPKGDEDIHHLYVVASTQSLEMPTFTEGTSEESAVRDITYSIKESDATAQIFMRDLYSTPYASDATFPGNLTDPMQDVFLYHVAAKVDVKWNSATTLAGNVLVNSVKDSGLSLFKPTTNEYGLDGEGNFIAPTEGGYSPSATIDPGMAKNGRYVFYLPQFANPNCTYSVTIGSNTGNIKFTPVTTNGFTSWLRTQVKQ